jgi:hypothetical protein
MKKILTTTVCLISSWTIFCQGVVYIDPITVTPEEQSRAFNPKDVFTVSIDKLPPQTISINSGGKFSGLDTEKTHTVVIKRNGKAEAAFKFNFKSRGSEQLRLWFRTQYQTWQLSKARSKQPSVVQQELKNMLWTNHFNMTSITSLQSRYPEGKELLFRQAGSGREVQTIFPKGVVPPGIDTLKSHKFTLHGKIITINEKPDAQAKQGLPKKRMINYKYFLVSSWTAEPKYKSSIDYIRQTGRLWGISEVRINNDASITLIDAKTGPGRGLMMSLSESQESATIKPGESCSLKDGHHAAIVYKLQKIEQGKLTFSITEKFDARSFGKGITTETKMLSISPYGPDK